MSEKEIAIIQENLDAIRNDIKELKNGYKQVIVILEKLVHINEKLNDNDEAHKTIFNKIEAIDDRVRSIETSKDFVTKSELKMFVTVVLTIFTIINIVLNLFIKAH